MEDPTTKSKIKKFGWRVNYTVFTEKLFRIVWFVIIAFIIIQTILFSYKMFGAKRPAERICWDRSTCFDYCTFAKQNACLLPDNKTTFDTKESLILLITGRRTIVEILDDQQKYCACEIEDKGKTRLETFYKFYLENK